GVSCHLAESVQFPSDFRLKGEDVTWMNDHYPFLRVLRNNERMNSLPATIPKPGTGKLTIWADYSCIVHGYLLVYIMNLTDSMFIFPVQDGDMYLKMEALPDEEKGWARAQRHDYSWCGNSYREDTLLAGNYLVFRGYYPSHPDTTAGKKMKVRYRIYNRKNLQAVSNIGEARITDQMLL